MNVERTVLVRRVHLLRDTISYVTNTRVKPLHKNTKMKTFWVWLMGLHVKENEVNKCWLKVSGNSLKAELDLR